MKRSTLMEHLSCSKFGHGFYGPSKSGAAFALSSTFTSLHAPNSFLRRQCCSRKLVRPRSSSNSTCFRMISEPPMEGTTFTAQNESPSPFFASSGFGSLGLSSVIVDALNEQCITRPTSVQTRGIPPASAGADVILGAATGSGKTLAYLLPVMQQLKSAEELREADDPPLRVVRRPRAVILAPTRELAEQVAGVAKTLSHRVKLRVVPAIGGISGTLRKNKQQLSAAPTDILIGTTGRIVQLMNEYVVDLRFAKHVVIDEVDTMFEGGFESDVRRILSAMGSHNSKPQCIAAGATHPTAAQALYRSEFPNAARIDVDLHRPPPGLVQNFISVNSKTKLTELAALLGVAQEDGSLRGGRMIVFCNTMDSVRFLDHYLNESGYTTSCIHGDVPPSRRDEEYNAFKNGDTQLLVCTDMAARGLDNLAVDHVVLFDFPSTAVDYIHRAGRTARAGAKGKVSSLVLKKDERLARTIQKASRGKADTLEYERIAKEEELERQVREEARAREEMRQRASGTWSEEIDTVPFGIRARQRSRPASSGRTRAGSFTSGRGRSAAGGRGGTKGIRRTGRR